MKACFRAESENRRSLTQFSVPPFCLFHSFRPQPTFLLGLGYFPLPFLWLLLPISPIPCSPPPPPTTSHAPFPTLFPHTPETPFSSTASSHLHALAPWRLNVKIRFPLDILASAMYPVRNLRDRLVSIFSLFACTTHTIWIPPDFPASN